MDVLKDTDDFYRKGGFSYDLAKVVAWFRKNLTLPKSGAVLDICCGDGIWSAGMKAISPQLEMWGVDISAGAIEKAKAVGGTFLVADAEQPLPVPMGHFSLIFARGPMIFNQHDMGRPGTVKLIEGWHELLTRSGRFVSVYYSKPEWMGTYTQDVKLPYNKTPRLTEAVDFRGGKYHHSEESFKKPFETARNVLIESYRFVGNEHILISRLK